MTERTKDVFLSYRNDGTGEQFASRLEKDLTHKGYSVYYNPNEMGASVFPDRLRKAITHCTDFIAIVTPGYLKRLFDGTARDNWIREEVMTAHAARCRITPLLVNGAKMPSDTSQIPEALRFFVLIDAIKMPTEYKETPFFDLLKALTASPDRVDTYKHVENSNPWFQVRQEYAAIEKKAKEGDADAALLAGAMCYYGFDGKRDYRRAEKWLRGIPQTDLHGYAHAANLLSHMYYSGQLPHDGQSYEESYRLHCLASDFSKNSCAERCFAERFGIGCEFDYEAVEQNYLRLLERKPDPVATLELAGFYESYGKWEKAAEQYEKILHVSGEAAYRLALLYKKGVLTDPPKPDYPAAASLLKPLVGGEYPHVGAAYELGMCCARPTGSFPKNFTEAEKCFRVAAERGHTEACYMLGWICENELSGPTEDSLENAMRYYETAAKQGHALAAHQLSLLYQVKSPFTNYHRAYRYATQAMNGGVSEAKLVLANLLLLGRGCEADPDCAYRYYRSAAEEDDNRVARLMMELIDGKTLTENDEREIELAARLYDSEREEEQEQAARITQRYCRTNGRAANLLGLMYHFGQGVPKDDAKATELFRVAASFGYRAAYFNLGDALFFGNGTKPDHKEAAECYRIAADMMDENGEGDHDAEAMYGRMLRLGIGVVKDLDMAKHYLYRASSYYTPLAPFEYGLCLEEEGRYAEALYWFTRAAERHIAEAALRLARYYRDGIGTEPDPVEAQRWSDLARLYGCVEAGCSPAEPAT